MGSLQQGHCFLLLIINVSFYNLPRYQILVYLSLVGKTCTVTCVTSPTSLLLLFRYVVLASLCLASISDLISIINYCLWWERIYEWKCRGCILAQSFRVTYKFLTDLFGKTFVPIITTPILAHVRIYFGLIGCPKNCLKKVSFWPNINFYIFWFYFSGSLIINILLGHFPALNDTYSVQFLGQSYHNVGQYRWIYKQVTHKFTVSDPEKWHQHI
jgi:hypothetical protein